MKGRIEIRGKREWLEILSKIFVDEVEDRRSRAKIYLTSESLVVEIEADDLIALRASLSSHLRLLRSSIETLEVIENG